MLHLLAFAVIAAFTSLSFAQDGLQYTVWSSVVLTRTGERTPTILTDSPTVLTSVGANQAYAAGLFFRNRYITSSENSSSNASDLLGISAAPITGLNFDTYDALQTWVLTRDRQWLGATAAAFLQGFYPPRSPSADPVDILADNTYVTGPLGGYQYPFIQTTSDVDPNYIYLDGNNQCPSFNSAVQASRNSTSFRLTQGEFDEVYTTIGSALLDVLSIGYWDYRNAYALWDYLRYEYAHNATAKSILDAYKNVGTNTSYLDTLRWLADEQQYAELGNMTAYNPASKINGYHTHTGSISTIAGNFLASNIVSWLQNAIITSGTTNKLNLLFADYDPFMSFFALTDLPNQSTNFTGLPDFGASMVFELYSFVNISTALHNSSGMPSTNDLRVRFLYRNGTNDNDRFLSYPLFNRPREQADMYWDDFLTEMQTIAISDLPSWCDVCGARGTGVWICAAIDADGPSEATPRQLSPAISGVIGAVVAIAVAGVVLGALMLFGGIRFRKNESSSAFSRRRKSDLGGFKGGHKMASDRDLTLASKGGAIVGAEVVDSPGGHERVGSWEMKQKGLGGRFERVESIRPSMEERGDPFDDEGAMRAVVPHERV